MIVASAFEPAWWLTNRHAQTMCASWLRRLKMPPTRVERLELPDDDFVDLVWLDEGLAPTAPLVILLHGLGGASSSHYIQAQMCQYKKLGWRSVGLNLRGAGPEPNRLLRSFHAGDTADLDFLLSTLCCSEPYTRKMGVGFSLGGNILLKWLGQHSKQQILSAAVAVSVPFDLTVVADSLNRGFARVYQRHLLRLLRQHFLRKRDHHPDQDWVRRLYACDSFWTFDHEITVPLNGFDTVHHYYQVSSCKAYLRHISVPTLMLHARDDPFMTPEILPSLDELSPHICLEISQHGGHVGFIGGKVPGWPRFWLDDRIATFLATP